MDSLQGCVKSLHHVSVGVDGAQEDIDFMKKKLGFRFIKATVLFDGTNPVYHLYYGDRVGSAGSVFTTFPWRQFGLTGRKGSGQIKRTAFSVPPASVERWYKRLVDAGTTVFDMEERLGQQFFTFQNPAGLDMEIIGVDDSREPWLSDEGVDDPEMAIRGLYSVVMSVQDADMMAGFLESVGFRVTGQERRYTRLAVGDGGPGATVELIHEPTLAPGTWKHATGLHHHFAVRVDTEEEQARIKEQLVGEGYVDFSEVKDRFYFSSIYVRSPGGILMEFATRPTPEDPPGSVGWLRDEEPHELGSSLQIPPWWEERRAEFIARLEPITLAQPDSSGGRRG